MSSFQQFIKNLQNKPYEVRTRILWLTTSAITIIIFGIWLIGFKQEFKNLDKQSILGSNTQVSEVSAQHYTNLDGIEQSDGKVLVYFSIKNDTNDILNFSKTSDIKLISQGKDYNPTTITDRQNQPFVQKILSNSQKFGIMTFELKDFKSGNLVFDSLFFENNPGKIFKEQLTIDSNKLPAPKNIRN